MRVVTHIGTLLLLVTLTVLSAACSSSDDGGTPATGTATWDSSNWDDGSTWQ
jgi:hypothetical protein